MCNSDSTQYTKFNQTTERNGDQKNMQYFKEEKENGKIIIRLDQGEMLLESIETVISEANIKNGVVISGIGTLSDARIHLVTTTGYPAVEKYPEWKNVPIELCSISGIIANGEPHLHTVFSDLHNTYCGHLEHGCKTLYLCEIVIELLENISLIRVQDEKGIFKLNSR